MGLLPPHPLQLCAKRDSLPSQALPAWGKKEVQGGLAPMQLGLGYLHLHSLIQQYCPSPEGADSYPHLLPWIRRECCQSQ